MRKPLLIGATFLCLFMFSCGNAASSSTSSSQPKGEEIVKTVDKSTWDSVITNAGLINPPTNVTLHIDVEGGQSGTIKIEYLEVEIATSYGGGNPIPSKYYFVMEDSAYLYVMSPTGDRVIDKETITRDDALNGMISAVGLVGSSFAYEQFTYLQDKGSYHCDQVNLPSGYNMHDVSFYFENNVLVRAEGKQDIGESDPIGVSLTADNYGTTTVTIPSTY